MINPVELRIGNYILHKTGVRILPTKCTLQHFELFAKGQVKDSFPIGLKPDILQKCGFVENKSYYQAPEVREIVLTLPIMGNNKNEIYAYISNSKDGYARVTVNNLVVTNNFHYLHQLQNVYYALVGEELEVML